MSLSRGEAIKLKTTFSEFISEISRLPKYPKLMEDFKCDIGKQIEFSDNTGEEYIYRRIDKTRGIFIRKNEIGSGFWGTVSLAYHVSFIPGKPIVCRKCVVKEAKKAVMVAGMSIHALKYFMDKQLGVDDMLKIEAVINRQLHRFGSLNMLASGQVYAVLPYLGDTTLTNVMQDRDLINSITACDWINLLVNLCLQLQNFQTMKFGDNYRIHNDIKPDNVGVVLDKDRKIVALNFFDFGNAKTMYTLGAFGDPRYASYESLMLLSRWCDEKVDVYALGKTLYELLDKLEKLLVFNPSQIDKKLWGSAKEIFIKMQDINPVTRLSLSNCIEMLISIMLKSQPPRAQV